MKIYVRSTIGPISLVDFGGFVIDATSVDLVDHVKISDIDRSDHFYNNVANGNIVVNDGYVDLTIAEALDHIRLESRWVDDRDYDQDLIARTDGPPDSTGVTWYNDDDMFTYSYDPGRGKWLSLIRNNYVFSHNGAIRGSYLAIGTVSYSEAGYFLPRPATICGIFGEAQNGYGDEDKLIRIYENGNIIESFYMDNWRYGFVEANINVPQGSVLKMYVEWAGGRIKYPIFILEIAWRYV